MAGNRVNHSYSAIGYLTQVNLLRCFLETSGTKHVLMFSGAEREKVWRMNLVGLLPEVSLHYSVYLVGA